MTVSYREQFNKVFGQLLDNGMLLMWDSNFPNVTHLVADEKVRGSWWGHKRAHAIFGVAEMLEDHPDVLIMKLISGKVTFVHRELWNRIYSIGVAREDWQLKQRAWTKRIGFRARAKDPVAARRFLEQRLVGINKKHNGHGQLPWPSTL